MSAAKWILGGLGFVLGGPIGAVVGVLIASLFDSSKALPGGDGAQYASASSADATYNSRNRRPTPGDIRVSVLVLLACVMKADGHVKKQELEVVKHFLLQNYGEEGGKQALQMLKQLLEQDIDYMSVAGQIRQHVNYSTRLEILHLLLEVAHADDTYDSQEQYVIERLVQGLFVSTADYRSLLALYGKKQDPDWAYKALEIEPSATNDEVKKAYRRMAMKYHPDKVASAGEDIKQKATEKFRAINEAYETVKKQRGMS